LVIMLRGGFPASITSSTEDPVGSMQMQTPARPPGIA